MYRLTFRESICALVLNHTSSEHARLGCTSGKLQNSYSIFKVASTSQVTLISQLRSAFSTYIVKPVDQQDQSKNQHFQPHTYCHINIVAAVHKVKGHYEWHT